MYDRSRGHDREQPRGGEGGKGEGKQEGGDVMRREGVERDTKRKSEGVKRRGGVCVDVVGVRNENVWYGRYGGAARKSRCEGEEMHARVVVQG